MRGPAIAAKWWADQLRTVPDFDNGEPFHGAFASTLAGTLPPIQTELIDAFQAALERRIELLVIESWNPDNPQWGALHRSVGTDYGPDGTLADALSEAGIQPSMLLLPWKTMMWVNPDSVRVAKGYRAAPVALCESQTQMNTPTT